jgi:hypothetical protein
MKSINYRIQPLRQQDLLALIALAAVFILLLAATWQRWTHPIIDHGREMNLPTRIIAGELLYIDIRYHYGPFAPYLNAILYIFYGINLFTLQTSGIICATIILMMVYWLGRQLMNVWESALATAYVMLFCAFNINFGNYIQPYAYAALYGSVFNIGALVCSVRYLCDLRKRWLCCAGICAGMTMICKPELIVVAVAPSLIAFVLTNSYRRNFWWPAVKSFALPLLLISVLTYFGVLSNVPLLTLVLENYFLFATPQMDHFNRMMLGLLDWPQSGWAILVGIGCMLLSAAMSAMIACVLAQQPRSLITESATRVWAALITGFAFLGCKSQINNLQIDLQPFRAAQLSLVVTILIIIFKWRLRNAGKGTLSRKDLVLLLTAVFSLISIVRVFFNVSLTSPYTPFTVPILIIIYFYLLFEVAPKWLLPAFEWRNLARKSGVFLFATLFVFLSVSYSIASRTYRSFVVETERGRLYTSPALGQPIAEAIRFAMEHTLPEDQLAVFPQGTMINFLSSRSYPFREEVLVPGFVNGESENEVIKILDAGRPPVVMLINYPTPEYRDRGFGVDYNIKLARWIIDHYHLSATFSASDNLKPCFGNNDFFILVYERIP